ncbi:MAG: c-type cytochrome domain-containing protein [Chitinophagaceae bacterium]
MTSIIEFIGRFHPVLVHLPIGILMISLLLMWLSKKPSYNISHQVIKLVLLLGMFGAIISCFTGTLLSWNGDYNTGLVSWHMWMGYGVAVASMFLYMKVARKELDVTYKTLSIGLLLLITITGHLGGSLTHGTDYLTSALTGAEDSVVFVHKPIPNIQEAAVYADVINPMLQTKCYSCHGPKKQKGKLRVDDPLLLMQGGKDGAVIVPSNVKKSELMKRLLLPENDEHHMPPKEKPQLKESQMALMNWWINEGADFNKKVKDLPQADKIKTYLLALQSDHIITEKKAVADVPVKPVEAANEKAIQALRDKGVIVIPVAQNTNYLSANFINANNVSSKDIALLKPLQKQLVWLKLGDTKINDSALTIISDCKEITSLQLNNTSVSDKGMVALKTLQNLQSLNLVGTKVTSQGVMQLISLKKLQAIYLYQTSVGKSDWDKLKTAFPKTMIDSGGYKLQYLEADTMLVKPTPEIKKQ